MGRNLLLAALAPLLFACGGFDENASTLNPVNWFGAKEKDKETPAQEAAEVQQDLVLDIVDLRIDPLADGAVIILASGIPPTHEYWNGELVPLNQEKPVEGTLTYEFRVSSTTELVNERKPETPNAIALRTVTSQRLEEVAQIVVLAQNNSRSIPVGQ